MKACATLRIVRALDNVDAHLVLTDAWWGGKNRGERRFVHVPSNGDGSGYVLADVPLSLVMPNESGERYDGTVDVDRARLYATAAIDTPVHLLFSQRAQSRGLQHASVNDGGHRVSAARMRGDVSIRAVMQTSHFHALRATAALQLKALTRPGADGAGVPLAFLESRFGDRRAPDGGLVADRFAEWFSSSKVVDSNGSPAVLFHGTGADVSVFAPSPVGCFGRGIYLAETAHVAEMFSQRHEAPAIVPVYARMLTPYVYRPTRELEDGFVNEALIKDVLGDGAGRALIDQMLSRESELFADQLAGELRAAGHDGIKVVYSDSSLEYVLFESRQLKSAIGSSGAFDLSDEGICDRLSVVSAAAQGGRHGFFLTPFERALVARRMLTESVVGKVLSI